MTCLGVTMGDASGVGPEIILRAHQEGQLPSDSIVIGDYDVLAHCNEVLSVGARLHRAASLQDRCDDAVAVHDMGVLKQGDLRIGELSRRSGWAALKYVEHATHGALAGDIRALVTLPMNKEATRLSVPDFSGHTGYIASLCGTSKYAMMLASDNLLVTHVSTHVSLREATERVQTDRIVEVIALTDDAVRKLGRSSRIAVLGLNPHAGEGGGFGREEIEQIAPAIEEARAAGMDALGPLPPDTVFAAALKGDYGAVVCMYHDQGHIPIKTVAFDEGVNATLGLPVVRTSVDHGTAFDIAWQGKASTQSFVNACVMADRLAGRGG